MANTNVASDELKIARKLITKGLQLGCHVSVYDGEEWPLHNSTKLETILDALGSTDGDIVKFVDKETGKTLGKVWLVWGNGEDLISDNTDNEWTNKLTDWRYLNS